MELVQNFKDQVNSIEDPKYGPSVSKNKMVQITRAAIKATIFYKHVVMEVERFIKECSAPYKVAGLYVIDSIVRQSRHQNGKDGDIFGPRFAKNLHKTFKHLFTGCEPKDRPRIVRVLNLWQKNGVFNAKTIQPLLDLAIKSSSGAANGKSCIIDESTNSSSQNELSHSFISGNGSGPSSMMNNNSSVNNSNIRISKSVLDFDYGEDDDDDPDETPTEAEPPLSSTLNKIELEHIHKTSKYQTRDRDMKQSPSNSAQLSMSNKTNEPDLVLERWNKLMKGQGGSAETPTTTEGSNNHVANSLTSTMGSQSTSYSSSSRDRNHNSHTSSSSNSHHTKNHHNHKQTAGPSTPTSKSPTTHSSPPNDKSSKKKITETEKEEERRRKCFPNIKDRHVTLCSSTLWLGHVPKAVTEADISDAFGEFGTINSIDLIPPRGCSYVCMDRRQDAMKALKESYDLVLRGSRIKMAWAPGKGLKEYKELKDYFELAIGCAFIPYSKINSDIDFDVLEEGGVIDEESMSMEMIETRQKKAKEKLEKSQKPESIANIPVNMIPIMSQPPPPYHLTPTSLATVPPPPSAWLRGQAGSNQITGIPFPPPRLSAPSASSLNQPPPPLMNSASDSNKSETVDIATSIEQKISMTEQQISMVEQQLNMMQQGQDANLPSINQIGPHMMNQSDVYGANPMMFDLASQPFGAIPAQMPLFNLPPPGLFGQPAPLIPINQSNHVNMSMDGGSMQQYNGRYS